MNKVYTELTLEKVEMGLSGQKRRQLKGYQEMFHCSASSPKNRKVLMKADPGMGKTTLGKKVTWDWAKGEFKDFSMIFFVALKLVKPDDLIENIIKQQNPELEGLDVRALLNKYSTKILIILDGLDEHRLGQNEDVLNIIKNQKLDCRVLVSSRPQSTFGIEEYFPTIVRVEGFNEKEARKFVSNFFGDESRSQIEQIMEFRPSDSRENFPVHKCPILLSILCFLVDRQEVDLLDTDITIGDLYFRMVRCLYKTYAMKKGKQYKESDLIEVMRSVGLLALRTLLSDNPLLQRDKVLKIAGQFALECGFFAMEKDFTHHNADVSVTYAHRSIEEFFWSFGFLQALDDGKSVDDILGLDCGKPIFMVNPLVLRFCLWLRAAFFGSERIVYDKLVAIAAQRIDIHVLDIDIIDQIYPAMGIRKALRDEDKLKLEFSKQVFEKCEQVRVFQIRPHYHWKYEGRQDFGTDVLGVLGLISHSLLSKLSLLLITQLYPCVPPDLTSNALTISLKIDSDSHELISKIHVWLRKYSFLKRTPQVCIDISSWNSQDLKILV